MKLGQETIIPNWALDAIEDLTNAADIKVLMFLARHGRYRVSEYSTKQLAIALELDVRTVQATTARLHAAGLILSASGVHCVYKAPARLTQAPCKSTRVDNEKNTSRTADSSVPKKGMDELMKEGTQERHAEPPTIHVPNELGATSAPVDSELQEAFEDDPMLDVMLAEAHGVPWESTASAITDTPTLPEGNASSQPTEGGKVPRRRAAPVGKAVESNSTPFQRMFSALALGCALKEADLTALVRGRIGKAARSLLEAKYTAEDIPSIVAWIRTNETWRTAKLSAQVIEECAPSWKAAVPGNVPLTAKATGDTTATSDARRRYEERYA
ncbi:hypothetical protein [Deinococcus yavapaiensis]|uniref:Uncharacterized protein n=1 Tax=Deinococcus yavapaiensis KR-236 TaxID=694435 RepID=A0A318S141_9DEIO|nr:hypothetical protein [Deinococcus yavapaiensis]PYE51035.1 hypothetical protein DES52_116102 [Deinococcus yavapaiensis KR-236]